MIAAPLPRGGGAAEAGGFLALALLLHLGAFALFGGPSGLVSGGAGGDAEATIAGAAPALSALVESWGEAPEAAAPAALAPAPTLDTAPDSVAPPREAAPAAPPRTAPAPTALAPAPVAPPRPVSPGLAPAPEPPAPEPPEPQEEAAPAAQRDIAPARAPSPPPRAEAPARAAPPPQEAAAEAKAPPPPAARAAAAPAREAPTPGPAEDAAPSARAEGSGGGEEAGNGDAPENVGDAEARRSALVDWGAAIRSAVEREKRAPAFIRRVIVAEVTFLVDGSGALVSAEVSGSAGLATFDEAALAAVRAASPYPAAPVALGPGPFPMTLAIRFRP